MENQNKERNKTDRRKTQVVRNEVVYGKVPPNAKETEEAILGALMLENSAIDSVISLLTPETFYVTGHQFIFRAILSLYHKNQVIDILTVVEELQKESKLEDVGGPFYVTRLTNSVVSSAHIERHSQIIVQKFIQRELIRIGSEIVTTAFEDSADAFHLLDTAEQQLLSIGQRYIQSDLKGLDTILVKTIQKIEETRKLKTHVTGIPTGYPTLDRATRGWQNSDLTILAARPSIGKTSFSLKLLRNAAKTVPVAMFNLEMADIQLALRMLASESDIPLYRIQTGQLEDDDMKILYQKGVQPLANLPIYIDDDSGLNITKLRAKARRLKKNCNIGLIILDYLQLVDSENSKGIREQEIAAISRGLKLLAKELNIPIIALSQLSRALESRTGPRKQPQLSDLRESGAIEQDADNVIFLYGPEPEEIEVDNSLIDRRYARIAKARNGMLITIDFKLNKDTQEWEEVTEDAREVVPTTFEAPRLPYADNDKGPF